MQSARRQKYCSYGIALKLYRDKKITCRKYAAVLNRKEKAENDPIVTVYTIAVAPLSALSAAEK